MELLLGFIAHCVMALFWSMIFFLISIPLHEISHYLFILSLHGRTDNISITPFKISWDEFNFGGSVDVDGYFEFPEKYSRHKRTVAFLFGLSGGLGSAMFLLGLAVLLIYVNNINMAIATGLFVAILAETLYAIGEGYTSISPEKLTDIKFTRR